MKPARLKLMSKSLRIEGSEAKIKHFAFLMVEDGRIITEQSATSFVVALPDELEAQYVTEEAQMKGLVVK
jgi:hypothetical protein